MMLRACVRAISPATSLPEEDLQHVVETSRFTSEVTTSSKDNNSLKSNKFHLEDWIDYLHGLNHQKAKVCWKSAYFNNKKKTKFVILTLSSE